MKTALVCGAGANRAEMRKELEGVREEAAQVRQALAARQAERERLNFALEAMLDEVQERIVEMGRLLEKRREGLRA